MSDFIQTVPLKRIVEHGPGVKSYYFPRFFDARPGQFINLWTPGVDEKPFSLSALSEDAMEVSVKAFGPFSQDLMKRQPGAYFGIRGPFGKGFTLRDNTLLIGGGIGIAPLRFLAFELKRQGYRFVSLLGAATGQEIIFPEKFKQLSQCYFTTDDGSLGRKGLVTDELADIIEKEGIEFVYAAGPEIMFVKVKEILDRLNMPYEFCMERYMKCGIGICGQCVLDGSGIRLCVEGPVLNRQQLQEVTELGLPHRDASGQRVG